MTRELGHAYAFCERLAWHHYENFPVASVLLPARLRPHIAAIYAFARLADDFADEGSRPAADRLADLDDWGARLDLAARGEAPRPDRYAPVFLALANTIGACRLPVPLLADLLSAFRQDVTTRRYATWSDVLEYCRRSANPVGRLVLRVAGHEDESLDAQSDAFCTALQLTNFWQDFGRDWAAGRLYVPAEIWQQAGARETDLENRTLTAEWRAALSEAGRRTRACFLAGRAVCDEVAGRLRWELRATWLGGMRILDRMEASGFDVLQRRPTLGMGDLPLLAWRMVAWGIQSAAHG